jgi:hypothetical protein
MRPTRRQLLLVCCMRFHQMRRQQLLLVQWMLWAQVVSCTQLLLTLRVLQEEDVTDGRWWRVAVPDMSDAQFQSNFRVSRRDFDYLADSMHDGWSRRSPTERRHSADVSIRMALALFLCRLSTKATLRENANLFGVARSTVCTVTKRMSRLVCARFGKLIQMPRTPEEWRAIARRWNQQSLLPNVVGALDGTLIPISRPFCDERAIPFWSRKQSYSYNVQALCDERQLFMNVAIGAPGASHDSSVLTRSSFFRLAPLSLPSEHYVLVDGGYPVHTWLIRPYEAMHRGRFPSTQEIIFNKQHASTRGVIERAFGILKSRWRKLHKVDMRNQDIAKHFIMSAFILHNFCTIKDRQYDIDIDALTRDPPRCLPAPRPVQPAGTQTRLQEGREERDAIAAVVERRYVNLI